MLPAIAYCSCCGTRVELRVPPGDHLERAVCPRCGEIHYRNPKVIVGCIPEWHDRILMCRRSIEPRLGRWTFPAGFLELGESTAQGAAREAREEARADVEVGALFAVIGVPYVSQIYMVHRGRLRAESFGPTLESSEVRLMRQEEIPWDEIAFPTVWHSLRHFFADRAAGAFGIHVLDIARREGPLPPETAGAPV
ncbi:MAG TPA: NUDIX hydrolase [Candidatus Binatia bacterium]|nr:NUDIX hydrolase [Candidatus Binatia bacterium]